MKQWGLTLGVFGVGFLLLGLLGWLNFYEVVEQVVRPMGGARWVEDWGVAEGIQAQIFTASVLGAAVVLGMVGAVAGFGLMRRAGRGPAEGILASPRIVSGTCWLLLGGLALLLLQDGPVTVALIAGLQFMLGLVAAGIGLWVRKKARA